MIEVRLLGQFEVKADGEPVKLPSRGAQALWAYLILNRDKKHRREKVAGVLWPDSSEEEARSKLRYALWELRKVSGEVYFPADRITIEFDPGTDFWVDVVILEEADIRGLSSREVYGILSVYQGELLPGFYEDWVILERERLRSTYDRKIELFLQRLLEEGSWGEAVEEAEKWISLGDAPEPAYRSLMIAHNRLGDISSAVSVYQRCVQMLDTELGVEPSPETQRVYEQISRGEKVDLLFTGSDTWSPDTQAGTVQLPAFLETKGRAGEENVFVAREQELVQLEIFLETAISGDGMTAFIRGDAGRGKTALLHEFSRRALERYDDLIVVYGSGEANTGLGDPHLPFRDVLSLLMGDIENKLSGGIISWEGAKRLWYRIPHSLQALMSEGPDLIESFIAGETILARTMEYPLGAATWRRLEKFVEHQRERPAPLNIQHSDLQKDLFEQYTKVLLKIAQQTPMLVVLDDLQWVDSGSTSMLFHLGRRIEGHRIMILGGYRADELAKGWEGERHPLQQVLLELKRKYGENEIDLDQSDAVMGRQFVDAFLDTEANKLEEKFRQSLHQQTGGHPLFTIELLRQMQAQGDLLKDQQGRWVEGHYLGWDTLPARVEAVIAGRINRLPDQLRDILRTASVEGEEFSAEVTAKINGMDVSTVVKQLSQELDQRHMLVEATGMQLIGKQRLSRYRFRHHLFQQYVYSSLDRVERTHLHEDVGEALEGLYHGRTDRIAVRLAKHFEEAGLIDKAVDYLLRAGEIAKRQSANEEAIGHLLRGLELLVKLPDDHNRARKELELQISLSAPLVATKGYTAPEAEQAFERAEALCRQVKDPSRLPSVLWGLWSFYLVRANYTTAKVQAEQILNLAQSNADPNLMLTAHWTLGITLVHLGEFTTAQGHLDQAIERYDPKEHRRLTYLYGQNPAVTCLIYSAYNQWFLGYPDQALEKCYMALRLAEEVAHAYSLAFVHGMAAGFFALRMEVEAALDHAQQAVTQSKEGGFPFMLALGLVVRGWARAALGKTSMSIGQIKRGIGSMQKIGGELGHPIFLFFLAEAHITNGQIDDALETVNQAIDIAEKNHERLNESDLYRLKGELLDRQGAEDSRVIRSFQEALEIARQQNARSFELRGLISLAKFLKARPEGEEAREALKELYAWFAEGYDTFQAVQARAELGLEN